MQSKPRSTSSGSPRQNSRLHSLLSVSSNGSLNPLSDLSARTFSMLFQCWERNSQQWFRNGIIFLYPKLSLFWIRKRRWPDKPQLSLWKNLKATLTPFLRMMLISSRAPCSILVTLQKKYPLEVVFSSTRTTLLKELRNLLSGNNPESMSSSPKITSSTLWKSNTREIGRLWSITRMWKLSQNRTETTTPSTCQTQWTRSCPWS